MNARDYDSDRDCDEKEEAEVGQKEDVANNLTILMSGKDRKTAIDFGKNGIRIWIWIWIRTKVSRSCSLMRVKTILGFLHSPNQDNNPRRIPRPCR